MATPPRAWLAVHVSAPSITRNELRRVVDDALQLADVTETTVISIDQNELLAQLTPSPRVLSLPMHLAHTLPRGARARLTVHADGGQDELAAMTRSPEVAAALDEIPANSVMAVVSRPFFDAIGAVPEPAQQEFVAETRFHEFRAYLWTVTAEPAPSDDPSIMALAVAPDGDLIVTGHGDGTIRRWDTATGLPVGIPPASGHAGRVRAVAIGGAMIISGGEEGQIRFWRAATGELLNTQEHGGVVTALAVDPRDRFAISAGSGRVVGWDLTTRGREWAMSPAHDDVFAVGCTSDLTIFLGSAHGIDRYTVGNVVSHAPSFRARAGSETALVILPDESSLVSAGGGNELIRVWNLRDGELRSAHEAGGRPLALTVTPDGQQIIAGLANGAVRTFDVSNGRTQTLHSGRSMVHAVAVTPDGRQVVAGTAAGELLRWDARTGQLLGQGALQPQRLADVVSDLESAEDALGVSGDVHTIATILAATSTTPPLSVALLGNWGAGKSSFMRQLRDRMDLLTRSGARVGDRDAFVGSLRQVTFNAWHYSDDHLWVGLIEHLFRELAEKPADPEPGRVAELTAKLDGEEAERSRLEQDLSTVRRLDSRRGWLAALVAPLRSWAVFRAAVRGAGRELRRFGWRIWLGLLVLAVGVAGVLLWQQYLGLLGLLAPVVAVWSQARDYLDAARSRLLARKAELDSEIRDTTSRLDELDPARRLDRLLAEISHEERYASFRGLTGRIHHDLRRLSADLTAARSRWEREGGVGEPPLQRIVLYVDDLDRCTPERVMDVLQAVNLLLTMDLFMVVVAVDPRWLLRSLSSHHGVALSEPEVAPVTYLDKIFHIPFALRPMGAHASSYLRSLLPLDETPQQQPEAVTGPRTAEPTSTAARQAEAPEPVTTTAQEPAEDARTTAEGLRVTADEREFLGRLTPLLATPRAIKKLTNLYRLLRLSVPHDELPGFLAGPYQAAALLLTALAGAPSEAHTLLTTLATQPDGEIVEVLKAMETPLGSRLAELMQSINRDMPVHTEVATYRRWAPEVARFGFETYALYTG